MNQATPTTPTAKEMLAWLRSERDFWANLAGEDELNTFTRHGAISRRDQLDMMLQRIPRDLARIEGEAVRLECEEMGRLDAILESVR